MWLTGLVTAGLAALSCLVSVPRGTETESVTHSPPVIHPDLEGWDAATRTTIRVSAELPWPAPVMAQVTSSSSSSSTGSVETAPAPAPSSPPYIPPTSLPVPSSSAPPSLPVDNVDPNNHPGVVQAPIAAPCLPHPPRLAPPRLSHPARVLYERLLAAARAQAKASTAALAAGASSLGGHVRVRQRVKWHHGRNLGNRLRDVTRQLGTGLGIALVALGEVAYRCLVAGDGVLNGLRNLASDAWLGFVYGVGRICWQACRGVALLVVVVAVVLWILRRTKTIFIKNGIHFDPPGTDQEVQTDNPPAQVGRGVQTTDGGAGPDPFDRTTQAGVSRYSDGETQVDSDPPLPQVVVNLVRQLDDCRAFHNRKDRLIEALRQEIVGHRAHIEHLWRQAARTPRSTRANVLIQQQLQQVRHTLAERTLALDAAKTEASDAARKIGELTHRIGELEARLAEARPVAINCPELLERAVAAEARANDSESRIQQGEEYFGLLDGYLRRTLGEGLPSPDELRSLLADLDAREAAPSPVQAASSTVEHGASGAEVNLLENGSAVKAPEQANHPSAADTLATCLTEDPATTVVRPESSRASVQGVPAEPAAPTPSPVAAPLQEFSPGPAPIVFHPLNEDVLRQPAPVVSDSSAPQAITDKNAEASPSSFQPANGAGSGPSSVPQPFDGPEDVSMEDTLVLRSVPSDQTSGNSLGATGAPFSAPDPAGVISFDFSGVSAPVQGAGPAHFGGFVAGGGQRVTPVAFSFNAGVGQLPAGNPNPPVQIGGSGVSDTPMFGGESAAAANITAPPAPFNFSFPAPPAPSVPSSQGTVPVSFQFGAQSVGVTPMVQQAAGKRPMVSEPKQTSFDFDFDFGQNSVRLPSGALPRGPKRLDIPVFKMDRALPKNKHCAYCKAKFQAPGSKLYKSFYKTHNMSECGFLLGCEHCHVFTAWQLVLDPPVAGQKPVNILNGRIVHHLENRLQECQLDSYDPEFDEEFVDWNSLANTRERNEYHIAHYMG